MCKKIICRPFMQYAPNFGLGGFPYEYFSAAIIFSCGFLLSSCARSDIGAMWFGNTAFIDV